MKFWKWELMTIVNYSDFFFFLDFMACSLLNSCSAVFTKVFVCRGLGVRNLLKQIESRSAIENPISFSDSTKSLSSTLHILFLMSLCFPFPWECKLYEGRCMSILFIAGTLASKVVPTTSTYKLWNFWYEGEWTIQMQNHSNQCSSAIFFPFLNVCSFFLL